MKHGDKGLSSAVMELSMESKSKKTNIYRVGIPDEFIEQGTLSELYEQVGLDAKGIAGFVSEKYQLLKKKKRSLKKWL